MNMNRKYLTAVLVIVLVGLFLCGNGCKKSGKESSKNGTTGDATSEISTKCSQIDNPKCPVEDFAQTHKYPHPEETK